MATAEAASRPHDRHTRKRPFTGWMKRLANLKSSSSDAPHASGKKSQGTSQAKSKKSAAKNNPYPQSGHFNDHDHDNARSSVASPVTQRSNDSFTSVEDSGTDRRQALAKSNKSTAPTVATNPETVQSVRSNAETGHSNTAGGGSTFSSPNHSERSLTTTLTTIQSTAPSNILNHHVQPTHQPSGPPVQFSHQFPTSPPASAIPAHLTPNQAHPTSYQTATANNILTDNASILTLASSSKRRRRNSLDTNASVRALAPSSVWGGSRESLPLSVLSANNAESSNIYSQTRPPGTTTNTTGGAAGGSGFANANAERASLYSSSGVAAPALSSERNSYYANKQADGLSVRSGLFGHGRSESITGSISGPVPTSPLASPRDLTAGLPTGRTSASRRSSEWKDFGSGDGGVVGEGVEEVEEKQAQCGSPVTSVHEEKEKGKVNGGL